MTESAPEPTRIGRPSKVDEHGTPTRERLLYAAVEACVEHGYDGATLADIARRADVSTPAIYSHFPGKAALLVEASKRELDAISTTDLVAVGDLGELARRWMQPDFARTRVLVAEIHCAAIRQPDVAELLAEWQTATTEWLRRAGLSLSQVKLFYLLLIGATHIDEVAAVPVTREETDAEMTRLLDAWIGDL